MDFDRVSFSKVKIPTPEKPEWFDLELTRISSGNLRVRWGQDLYCFRAGDPQAIKYPFVPGVGLDRWVMEVKLQPGFFGPRDKWEEIRYSWLNGEKVDLLGPYPDEDAHWGMMFPLVDIMGGYLPCGEEVLRWARWHRQNVESRPMGKFASLAAYKQMMEAQAEEDRERRELIEKNSDDLYEYSKIHESELNRNAAYSIPKTGIYTTPEPLVMTFSPSSKLIN